MAAAEFGPAGRRAPRGLAAALIVTAALFALAVPSGPLTAQELPTARVLPLSLARAAAGAALAACGARGYRVSVAVVDSAGLVKVLLKGDGAGPHTLDSSSRKAYTALTLRRPTSEFVKLIQKRPGAAGLKDMNEKILILGGGLPIAAEGEVIGGIGVGGAPGGDLDEACAEAGIEAIRERVR